MILIIAVAYMTDKHMTEFIQHPALRAPEVTIGADWDAGIDIWSLGCLVSI